MLNGVDFHRPLNERGRALDGLHMGGGGFDNRFIGEVDALKFEPVAYGRGQEREGDILAGVEGASGEACRGCEGALVGHDGMGVLAGQAMQEVEILLVGGAKSQNEFAADRAEDLDGGSGLETGQNADRGASDAEEFAILERRDIRRAGAFIDEGDFAEKVADFESGEFHFLIRRRGLDKGGAGEQKIETVTLVAGLDDLRAFGKSHRVGEAHEGRKLVVAKPRKKRKLLKTRIVRLND
jgi:hypothetical protein